MKKIILKCLLRKLIPIIAAGLAAVSVFLRIRIVRADMPTIYWYSPYYVVIVGLAMFIFARLAVMEYKAIWQTIIKILRFLIKVIKKI